MRKLYEDNVNVLGCHKIHKLDTFNFGHFLSVLFSPTLTERNGKPTHKVRIARGGGR